MKEVWVNARFLTQQISGVQIFALEICKHLKQLNPNIKFVAPKNIIHKEIAIQLDVITFGNFKGQLWEQIDLPLYLLRNNTPTLLNLCNSAPLFYKKNLVTIHDLAFIENPKWFSFAFKTWYNFLIPIIAKRANSIYTVSSFSKNEIIEKLNLPEKNIHIVPNGLSSELIEYKKENRNIIREKIILTVGSINPRKNIDEVILAFNALKLKDYKLVIVGAENNNFSTSTTSNKYKNVHFLGYLSNHELWTLYQKAEIFIYPSLYEGFGIPILESLYFECPVIATNLKVYTDIYQDYNIAYTNGHKSEDYHNTLRTVLSKNKELNNATQKMPNNHSYYNSANLINNNINE